jgi:hypothetical protein
VNQTEVESQSDLTPQSTEAINPLDPSNEGCVSKLEPEDQIESVVLENETSYEEKEILERETGSDIVTVSGNVQVLEETVQS